MVEWKDAEPGEYPVFLVGAGFSLAVLNPRLPSTADLISDTVARFGSKFPLISRLHSHPARLNLSLDFVWTYINDICRQLIVDPVGLLREYGESHPTGHPMLRLAQEHVGNPAILLGVELKRMLALQYSQANLHVDLNSSPELTALMNRLDSVVSNLATVNENLVAARGRILDADFGAETARLVGEQILIQAGAAMLAQANIAPTLALDLLAPFSARRR